MNDDARNHEREEEEDLADVWSHVVIARGFLRNLQGVN
jgi:hypothetical protein